MLHMSNNNACIKLADYDRTVTFKKITCTYINTTIGSKEIVSATLDAIKKESTANYDARYDDVQMFIKGIFEKLLISEADMLAHYYMTITAGKASDLPIQSSTSSIDTRYQYLQFFRIPLDEIIELCKTHGSRDVPLESWGKWQNLGSKLMNLMSVKAEGLNDALSRIIESESCTATPKKSEVFKIETHGGMLVDYKMRISSKASTMGSPNGFDDSFDDSFDSSFDASFDNGFNDSYDLDDVNNAIVETISDGKIVKKSKISDLEINNNTLLLKQDPEDVSNLLVAMRVDPQKREIYMHRGIGLDDVVQNLTSEQRYSACIEILKGVYQLWKLGLAHGDLKLDNAFVMPVDYPHDALLPPLSPPLSPSMPASRKEYSLEVDSKGHGKPAGHLSKKNCQALGGKYDIHHYESVLEEPCTTGGYVCTHCSSTSMQSGDIVPVEPSNIRPVRCMFDALPERYRVYPLSTFPAKLELVTITDSDTIESTATEIDANLVYQPSVQDCQHFLAYCQKNNIFEHTGEVELQGLCANIGVPFHYSDIVDAARLMVPMNAEYRPTKLISGRVKGSDLKQSFGTCVTELQKVQQNNVLTKGNLHILLAIPGAYVLQEKFRELEKGIQESGSDVSQSRPQLNSKLYEVVTSLEKTFTSLIEKIIDSKEYLVIVRRSDDGGDIPHRQCIMGSISPYSFPHSPWLCIIKSDEPYTGIPNIPKCMSTGIEQISRDATQTVQILGNIDSDGPMTEDPKNEKFWAIVQTAPSIKLPPAQSLDDIENASMRKCFKQTRRLIRIVTASWLCAKVIVDHTKKAEVSKESTSPTVLAEHTCARFATKRQSSLSQLLSATELIYVWTTVLKNMRTVLLAASTDVPDGCSLKDITESFHKRFRQLFWTKQSWKIDEDVAMPICVDPLFFTIPVYTANGPSSQLVMEELLDLGDELFKFQLGCGSCCKLMSLPNLFQQWKFGQDGMRYQLMKRDAEADCMMGTFLGTTIVMPYVQEDQAQFYVIRNKDQWISIQKAELSTNTSNSASIVMFNNLKQTGLDAPLETDDPIKRPTHAMLMAEGVDCDFQKATVNRETTIGMVNVKWKLNMYKWAPGHEVNLNGGSEVIHGNPQWLKLKDEPLLTKMETKLRKLKKTDKTAESKGFMFLQSFFLVERSAFDDFQKWGLNAILSKDPSNKSKMLDVQPTENAVVCYLDGAKNVTVHIKDGNRLEVLDKKGALLEDASLAGGEWMLFTVIYYADGVDIKAKNTGLPKLSGWFMNAWYAARWNAAYGTVVTPTQHIAGIMTLQALAKNSKLKQNKLVGTKEIRAKRGKRDCHIQDMIRLTYKTSKTSDVKINMSFNDNPLTRTKPSSSNARELLDGLGVCMNRENGHDITYDDAEKQILDAESPLYLQRSYSDGSYAKFEILPKGMLKAIVA